MKKVIDFCKQKYKILIPIMVVFVLLLTLYFWYREYSYDNYRNREEVSVYQYFGGIRTDYTAIITSNLKNDIVSITGKDKKIDYDSTPIYYKDELKVIFPNEMSIIFPLKEDSQYKLYKYTTYGLIDDVYKISSGKESTIANNFFLFDGDGLYFFPDEVSLQINGKEYIKLSANSYAEIVGGYTLTYYDYENNKSEMLEIEGKKVNVKNDYLDLSLSDSYLMMFNKKAILVPPYNLKALLDN